MVLSLSPVIMSLAMLGKTALDMAGQDMREVERRQTMYQGGEEITQLKHQLQFNIENFYREDVASSIMPRPELLIQPGELYSHAYDSLSSDSFYAQTPLLVDDVVPINDHLPVHVDNTETESYEEEKYVIETGSKQSARESVEEHLKKISKLPSSLKDKVELDLMRRIITAKTGTTDSGKRTYLITV